MAWPKHAVCGSIQAWPENTKARAVHPTPLIRKEHTEGEQGEAEELSVYSGGAHHKWVAHHKSACQLMRCAAGPWSMTRLRVLLCLPPWLVVLAPTGHFPFKTIPGTSPILLRIISDPKYSKSHFDIHILKCVRLILDPQSSTAPARSWPPSLLLLLAAPARAPPSAAPARGGRDKMAAGAAGR